MTPLELSILLHYYSSADDFREGNFSSPAVREAIDNFIATDMLTEDATRQRNYILSFRAIYFIEFILTIPTPKTRYVIDLPNEPQED